LLARWPIRYKLLLGLALLLTMVATLGWNSFQGLYDYRDLLKNLERVAELPRATELARRVGDLRVAALAYARLESDSPATGVGQPSGALWLAQAEVQRKLDAVAQALGEYQRQLERSSQREQPIGDAQREWDTIRQLSATLDELQRGLGQAGAPLDVAFVNRQLNKVQALVAVLPQYLQQNIERFPGDVRDQYRRRIRAAWLTTGAAAVLGIAFVALAYRWVFRPLRVLVKGSRKVAGGEFAHRIEVSSHDEIAELAAAMNHMTERFCAVRDDLDAQVQQRTRDVVRSQRLASVAYLAAGVAHEINRPLERIAAAAEECGARLESAAAGDAASQEELIDHLQQIQQQAFCCKEITQNLLDFSRSGDAHRAPADLRDMVQTVLELLHRVGATRHRRIELGAGPSVWAAVNAQEIKQVILNLAVYCLERAPSAEAIRIDVQQTADAAVLLVTDHGEPLSAEERQRLFHSADPGRCGPRAGLAVAAIIIEDHGGRIDVESRPGESVTVFRVWLPLVARADARPAAALADEDAPLAHAGA
jgi:two-component system NtrC family sensor kinase